jgi:hypothetical protein
LPTDNDFTKILGWPGYRVYRHEINERAKTLKLWRPSRAELRTKRNTQREVAGDCIDIGRYKKTWSRPPAV